MHHKDFAEIVRARFAKCDKTLNAKGEEYSRDGDRLHNFKAAAKIDGTSPTRSLWGMWKKHLVSIIDILDDLDRGIIPSQAVIDEKFGDSINYHLLAEGLIEEVRIQGVMMVDQALANANDVTAIVEQAVANDVDAEIPLENN